MIRLFLLIVLTLAGFVLLLNAFGDPVARPVAKTPAPVTETPPVPDEATLSEALGEGAGTGADGTPPADLVQVTSQTPEQIQRFPGPPLEPSPEYAGRTPPPAAAALPEGTQGPFMVITGNRVNMRAGPSTSDAVLTALDGGTQVEALGPTGGDWVNIRTPGGQSGYVSGQFLRAAN